MFFGDEARILAILLAIAGAIFLSIGAQLQNDAVTKSQGAIATRGGLRLVQVLRLARSKRWLLGALAMGAAVVSQLAALSLAPLIVVQPIGALALIITSILNAKLYKISLDAKTITAIAITFLGVASFVGSTAFIANEAEMTDFKLLQVVGLLAVSLVIFGSLFYLSKGKVGPLNYVFGAGVLYGFVASLAKVVILRLNQLDFGWLTILALAALLGATVLGGWFVQNAYASGPPDLVIAGLTVIDPAVAILIAIFVLGEASQAAGLQFAGLGLSGLIAAVGVLLLAKVHPQVVKLK